MENTGQNVTTIPTPVREKREIEDFEIEDFSTTKKPKSYTNTMGNTFTTTVSTLRNEANFTETTTEFQTTVMETTTITNLENSNV